MVSDGRSQQYISDFRKKILRIILLFLFSVILGILSLSISKFEMTSVELFDFLYKYAKGGWEEIPRYRKIHLVVFKINIPIAIAAIAAGATLAACGAAMQSILRNPLADPFTLGISSAAALGAALYISMGIALPWLQGNFALMAMAFLFAMIPTVAIVSISVSKKTTATMTILIGVAMMYMFNAATSLVKVTADIEKLSEIFRWSVGTLNKVGWDGIPVMLIVMVLSIVLLTVLSKDMNALSLGDDGALSLGVNPSVARAKVIVTVSLCTAAIVCFTGTIGFVGLVAPHIARIFVGSDNRILVPCAGAVGSLMLIASDMLARTIGPAGLPVGVVTALIGSPIFIVILIKQKRSAWN
ncbi:MAG: iron ABC transporter permease [Thermoplasmatales archaeon]|nr:iron ABC transporter permease [Thermoplasmatales archaeon]